MTDPNDDQLEKFLRTNRPEIPGAPAGELRALLAKIDRPRAKIGWMSRAWIPTLAATLILALGLSIWARRQRNGNSDAESAELAKFLYRSMVVDGDLDGVDVDEESSLDW